MYICLRCGYHFETPKETHNGGYPEEPTYECPNCGSDDFEDAFKCCVCGEDFADDDMCTGAVCKGCAEKAATIKNAFAYGNDLTESVEINGFLAWVYPPDEINRILREHCDKERKEYVSKLAKEFCTDDVCDFADWLEEHHDTD